MPPSSELNELLRATLPGSHEGLALFDRIAGAPAPLPDFIEWSAHLSDDCEGARLTYYFDAGRKGEGVARAAGERFAALAEALTIPLPAALLPTYFAAVPGAPEVQQVVLGLDDRGGAICRGKLYLVLQDSAAPLLERLLEAAGETTLSGEDLRRVYILGLDFGVTGLIDAKLYYRLDTERLPRVVDNLQELGSLRASTREVVLQRCLRNKRSQLYFHVDNPHAISPFLAGRAAQHPAAAQLLRWYQAVRRELEPTRLEPWIISFAYHQRRLDTARGNVYFHLLEAAGEKEHLPRDRHRKGQARAASG